MGDPELDGVRWVRLTFVDVFGSTSSVQLPAHRFAAAVADGEPFDGSALEGRARSLESDMRLRPDAATLHRIDDVAQVACTVWTPDGHRWLGDPRTALADMLEGPLAELADAWSASAELEFYLLDRNRLPVDRGGYFEDLEGIGMEVARAAADRLAAYGVEVTSCHHEVGAGQYELDLAPLAPQELADGLVLAKQTVREVAGDAALTATFMARPFNDLPGSGLHIHQALEGLIDGGGDLTDDGSCFVAGQLRHARAMAALASPTVNSYKRLHAGPEAPGATVWAHVNRAALIRIGADGHAPAIEYRGADPSANPYLLVAALLIAGGDGMATALELDPPVEEAPGTFDPSRAVRYEPLPRSLDEALDALLSDDVFLDAFDPKLLSHLVDGRRAEAEAYRGYVTAWELDRYLEQG